MPTETLTKRPDPALFLDFLDPNLSLLDLADRHQLALDDLLDWSEHPETHQRLTRLHTLITLRNSYLAAEKLPIALTSLTAAATQTAPPNADPALAHRTAESARRAATQLARLASLAPSRALSRATDHPALRTVGEPAAITPSQPTPSDASTHAPSGALEVPALGHIETPTASATNAGTTPATHPANEPIAPPSMPASTDAHAPECTDDPPRNAESLEEAMPGPRMAPLHLTLNARNMDSALVSQATASLPSRAVAHPSPDP